MTAATLANLVLTFSLATSGPVAEAPAAHPEQPGQPVVMEPGEASGNGAAGHQGGHEAATLPEVMMHHVANGEVMELPGFCPGFQWNCEVNFRKLTGGWVLHLDGVTLDMTPSKHLVMMWLAGLLLTVLMLAAARRRSLVPRGLYNFFELLVQFVRGIAVANIGKRHADRFVPYLAAAFFFILFMNLLGLVPFMATATANVSVTVALALFTFVITQYTAIRSMGLGGFLKHLTGGVPVSMCWLWPIMVPVEIMGLFTKPFALTVRLFANMVAGHFVILALLGLIFSISILVAPASVAIAVAMCLLELFVAFVQAYIFTMLSALFIGSGLVHHGDHEQEHDHAHPGAVEHGSHVAGKVPGHG